MFRSGLAGPTHFILPVLPFPLVSLSVEGDGLLLGEGDLLLGGDGSVQGGKGFIELLEGGDGHDILPTDC